MDFGDFTITKREVIFSIVIIAVMLIFGLLIHGAIDSSLMTEDQEYNTALRIDGDADMFKYGMSTNVGHAYVHGELKAVDTVTFDEIGGQYSSVEKVKERYTQHTRVETYTVVVNGKSQTRTRTVTYWTWDRVDSWNKHINKITFLGVEFPYGTISFSGEEYITTIKESSHIRYKYYGAPIKEDVVVYAELKDNTLKKEVTRYNTTIDAVHKSMTGKGELVVFWVVWILLTGGAVFAFVYIDNHWLEDKRREKHGNKELFGARRPASGIHRFQKHSNRISKFRKRRYRSW